MDIFNLLESLPWAVGAIVTVGAFVAFTITGILIVRKCVNHKTLKAHHDVAGFVFTNLGVLYGVLLGFTVVNVQQRFDKLKDNAMIEANYLADLYRDAEVFSEKDKIAIRTSLINYGNSVVNSEWHAMANGIPIEHTTKALKDVWGAYYVINPTIPQQQAWFSESISKLNQLMNSRLARILGSTESLGTEMWTLLTLGGLVMITFIWFFGLESLLCHILMASILAATTAFLLFLIYSLDTAFSGAVTVPPEALQQVLQSFE